jgi:hypothetical protein
VSGEGRLGRYAYSACVDCVAVVKVRCALLWLSGGSVGISSCWRCSGPLPPPLPIRPRMTLLGSGCPRIAVRLDFYVVYWGGAWAPGFVYSDDCVEGCTSLLSSEVDATTARALLSCLSPVLCGFILGSRVRCGFRTKENQCFFDSLNII